MSVQILRPFYNCRMTDRKEARKKYRWREPCGCSGDVVMVCSINVIREEGEGHCSPWLKFLVSALWKIAHWATPSLCSQYLSRAARRSVERYDTIPACKTYNLSTDLFVIWADRWPAKFNQ